MPVLLRLLLVLPLVSASACAQPSYPPRAERVLADDDWCDDHDRNPENRDRSCEVRETVTRARALDVNGHPNGGVTVKRWDRGDVLVRARVLSTASSQSEADRLVAQSRVVVHGGSVHSEMPDTRGHRNTSVSVSYEIFAPRQTDLAVRVVNGPIGIFGLDGTIRAEAVNGPIAMEDVAGDVQAHATNGPVSVSVEENAWRGAGLDVETVNGPVTLSVPREFSARLAARTNVGRISIEGLRYDQGDRQQGRYVGDALETTLGRGGAPVRLRTQNGPVRLRAE